MHPALLCLMLFCAGCLPEPPQEDPRAPENTSTTRPTGGSAVPAESETATPRDTAEHLTHASTELPAPTASCLPMHGIVTSATRWTYAWTATDRIGTRRALSHAIDEQDQTATIKRQLALLLPHHLLQLRAALPRLVELPLEQQHHLAPLAVAL